jgi:hypothetical protein
MKRRIAAWAGAGFLVALIWAIYAFVARPLVLTSGQPVTDLIRLTCPISLLSSHPIRLYTVLLANAATYALIGLIAETVWRRLIHAK